MTVLLVITPLIVPLVITVMIVIVAMCGDKLLTKVDHHGIKAIIDSTTHGSVALFSWAVVVFNSNSIHDLKVFHCAEILGCGAIASLIDVDHFLAARSFRLQDALQLSRRPPFHSSSLLILVFFSLYLSAKVFKSSMLNQMGWIILVAGGSHHLRDAVRRGLWFPPFGSTPPLHQIIYLVSLAFFPHIVAFLMPNVLLPKKTRYITV
ncbi:transmembrane protein 267 isoform X2 [Halyomorpha halys]|uniref:transmembrane protein 267 isoform X2 n=1 Tax=Halyomorpha halys TaxID=286706 RepID=UPI0006D51A9F|nr:transmembrane protein 267 isoform X2 [Halyomorpha halys]